MDRKRIILITIQYWNIFKSLMFFDRDQLLMPTKILPTNNSRKMAIHMTLFVVDIPLLIRIKVCIVSTLIAFIMK
ncbi:hypothetical protein H311_04044 [Anncaliia algerae PRA109]|nr:hypothetical protein H311_04044 [Anncaliia algerae PRA109]